MESKAHTIIGWLVLIAWGVTLGMLSPVPPTVIEELRITYENQVKKESKGGQESSPATIAKNEIDRQVSFITKRIWFEWLLKLSLLLVGIAGALMTLSRRSHWALVVLCTSFLYLAVWVIYQATLAEPFLEAYLAYANALLNSGEWFLTVRFFVYSLLLPLFHFAIIAYLFLYRPA